MVDSDRSKMYTLSHHGCDKAEFSSLSACKLHAPLFG